MMVQTTFAGGVNPWLTPTRCKPPAPPAPPSAPTGKKIAPRRVRQEQMHAVLRRYPGLTPPELVAKIPGGNLFRVSATLKAMQVAKVPSARREGVPGKYRYFAIGEAPTTKTRQLLRYLKRYPRTPGWTGRELSEKLKANLAVIFTMVYTLERAGDVVSTPVRNKSTGRDEKHFTITAQGELTAARP